MHSRFSVFAIFVRYTQAFFDYENTTNKTTISERRDVDRGHEYGSVVFKNWCDYDIYLRSTAAWEYPDNFAEDKDRTMIMITVPAGSSYHEAYRQSCPKPSAHASMIPPPTCKSLGKMEGQAVSIKISNTTEGPENIIQLEYALIKNPERHDTFIRLDYDVSLLNCAQITGLSEKQVAADPELTRKKFAECPAIQAGLALWFDNTDLCRPIYCDGETYCDGIYNYSPSEPGEDSFACHQEYKGNMYFEMCVGKGDGLALEKYLAWAASYTTASQLPTSTPTNTKGPWTTDFGSHTSTGPRKSDLTITDGGGETLAPDDEKYTSCPVGSDSPELEETVTSTTIMQQTITITYPKSRSSSNLLLRPTTTPYITDPPKTNSEITSFPITCEYDVSLESEVCWSQMPPKTASIVTVTTTVVVTETPNPVTVTRFRYVTTYQSRRMLSGFHWPQPLISESLTHLTKANVSSLVTTTSALPFSSDFAMASTSLSNFTIESTIPSSSSNLLSMTSSTSTIPESSLDGSSSTTSLSTTSSSTNSASTCTAVSQHCKHQEESYGKSPEGEQNCRNSPCIKEWCGHCMTMENKEWGCQCLGVTWP